MTHHNCNKTVIPYQTVIKLWLKGSKLACKCMQSVCDNTTFKMKSNDQTSTSCNGAPIVGLLLFDRTKRWCWDSRVSVVKIPMSGFKNPKWGLLWFFFFSVNAITAVDVHMAKASHNDVIMHSESLWVRSSCFILWTFGFWQFFLLFASVTHLMIWKDATKIPEHVLNCKSCKASITELRKYWTGN